jgi:predicted transcriptional regulator
MVGGCNGISFFEDGYGGGEGDSSFVRRVAMAPNQEKQIIIMKSVYSSNVYCEHKGESITLEEFNKLLEEYNFSTTPVVKYELTEVNIRKFVK